MCAHFVLNNVHFLKTNQRKLSSNMNLYECLRQFLPQNLFLSAFIILRDFILMIGGLASANALTNLVKRDFDQFMFWILVEILAYIFYCYSLYIQDFYTSKVIQLMDTSIRQDIANRLAQSGYEKYHEKNEAVYSSWVTNDINTINQNGLNNVYDLIDNLANISFSVIALAYYHFSLILSAIVLSALVLATPHIFTKRIAAASLSMTQGNEKLTNQLTDILEGFNPLYMLNLSRLIVSKTVTSSKKAAAKNNHYARVYGSMSATTNAVSVMCQTVIMIQTGLLVFAKLVTIGAVNATQNFAGSIFVGITGTSESLIAIKAVQPIFDKFTQLPDSHKQPTAELNHFNQQLSVHNLSFGYDHRPEILKQISLTIEKNHKYALIGDSGSGKTTLLNILAGKLTSYTGELMIDGLNYQDLDLSQVREQIYCLDQDPYIFNDSLRNNITLDDHFHDLDLDKIIDQTGLSKLVSRLPDGLDTILQHKGSDLSGGEKQRIVLARGLSSKRKIFLIDEGTSALDNRSRTEIEDPLTSDPQLTVVMVTHQLRKELEPKLDRIYKITAHSLVQ